MLFHSVYVCVMANIVGRIDVTESVGSSVSVGVPRKMTGIGSIH